MIVVISDDSQPSDRYEKSLRRLRAQHEILWITIGDASGLSLDNEFYDIDNQAIFPESIKNDSALQSAFKSWQRSYINERSKSLERMGIVEQRITGDYDVVQNLFKLLERQKHAKRS